MDQYTIAGECNFTIDNLTLLHPATSKAGREPAGETSVKSIAQLLQEQKNL